MDVQPTQPSEGSLPSNALSSAGVSKAKKLNATNNRQEILTMKHCVFSIFRKFNVFIHEMLVRSFWYSKLTLTSKNLLSDGSPTFLRLTYN
uniref:Uncharacterized protein n=1 Tax=Octopus bimaculoides TaxID=37653 RepID=A0A0L8IDS4_OCTBM